MRHWHIIFVALAAAVLTFVCLCLAPNVTVWPLIVLDGPALLLSTRLPDMCYLVLTPVASAVLFSIYALVLLITRGRVRLFAALLMAVFHALCAVAVTLALPNPPY